MLALGLLTFGASWLTDLNNQTSVESSELVNVFGRKEWATFWELYAPIISLLFIGAAGIIPLAFLFGSKLGTFSRRFVIFFSVWMVTEFVLLLLVIQPREIFEIEFRSVIY